MHTARFAIGCCPGPLILQPPPHTHTFPSSLARSVSLSLKTSFSRHNCLSVGITSRNKIHGELMWPSGISSARHKLMTEAYEVRPELQSSGSIFRGLLQASLRGSILNAQRTRTIAIQVLFPAMCWPGHFLLQEIESLM